MSARPIIVEVEDTPKNFEKFKENLHNTQGYKDNEVLFKEYPIVYIHHAEKNYCYYVYVGETNNLLQRTMQHYKAGEKAEAAKIEDVADSEIGEDTDGDMPVETEESRQAKEYAWQLKLREIPDWKVFFIACKYFNKSFTLDLENRLYQYIWSLPSVTIMNGRGNPQGKYYPYKKFDSIFKDIWDQLHVANEHLFPPKKFVEDSAIFKASPFHKLTEEQKELKKIIIGKVIDALDKDQRGQLIFISGEAGTGKTVLNSSTFCELLTGRYTAPSGNIYENIDCRMLVNHSQQLKVYEAIAKKIMPKHRGDNDSNLDRAMNPSAFINSVSEDHPVDVAFVDEAHLLWTVKGQGYNKYGERELDDIIKRARVTVIMFDENQILTEEQYYEQQYLDHYKMLAGENNRLELKNQLRMHAKPDVIDWIDSITKQGIVKNLPHDMGDYEIKIFNDPMELEAAIKNRAQNKDTKLSRLIASYHWPYNANAKPDCGDEYWYVKIGEWKMPWNYQREDLIDKSLRRKYSRNGIAWSCQDHTIDEVGSTFTIQGFDLDYAGVILGPGITYRNGRIVFDPDKHAYKKVTQQRTLSDGTKKSFAEELMQHEFRVLMTRGVHGLYIYACDDELRKALKQVAARR